MQWEASLRFIAKINPKVEKITDVKQLYTTELLDEANRFDRKAFEASAKAFKYTPSK
jgi:hypothetical protein